MIKQVFDIDGYWKVIVYYNADYNFFDDISLELRKIGFPKVAIEEMYNELVSGNAKAVTCSKPEYHTSIVVFNPHKSKADYISSIVHEAEHIKQAILDTYDVEDRGEAPAYTIGYIVSRMYDTFNKFI